MFSNVVDLFIICDFQLPNGANISAQLHQEKRNKVEEHLKFMAPQFRKLSIVYNKVLEDTAHLEGQCIEVIISNLNYWNRLPISFMI